MELTFVKTVLAELISEYLRGETTQNEVIKKLIETVDCTVIYTVDDLLVSDSYFALKHLAEETIQKSELIYLLQCLRGEAEYSLEEKLRITR